MKPGGEALGRGSRLRQMLTALLGGRLRAVLVASFSMVVALTVGLNVLATSRVIGDYLTAAENERVARDMDLAKAFYQLKLDEIAAISQRLVLDPWVIDNLELAALGNPDAVHIIDQQITNKITVLALGGTHLIAALDPQGEVLIGRVLSAEGQLSAPLGRSGWGDLPIVADALASAQQRSATEVLPSELLTQVGLDRQALVPLLDTPRAAPNPFDAREGSAGLALTGVAPLLDQEGQVIGAALAAYLFNNDFTLVDRIKQVAGVDTVTIFFGDLRVSTNVMTEAGERAVGTRVSQEVYDVVLEQGRDYVGQAFVVNQNYITRYAPLQDHRGQVVGSLYVGARESTFRALLEAFNERVALIGLLSLALAGVIAMPISRLITRPIGRLVEATQKLAAGDMQVRVEAQGQGELAALAHSFNGMVETLNRTQQELLHKEKLASMGQLAAGVAHEINNPLGTILLFADILYKEMPENDERRADLRRIIDEARRCKTIVADLLNFARQQEVLTQETDLGQLLERAIDAVQHQPSFGGVRIQRCFDSHVPTIEADPEQLQQVFVNLLNNAAEAMPHGGTITLTTSLVDGNTVQVEVADTGFGIPQESLGKLYTPFFTTKSPGSGTGLGLSIVYGIIKMHRGQIGVESEVGRGTAFTVTLPMRLSQMDRTPSTQAAA